jgi:hypothetical protein
MQTGAQCCAQFVVLCDAHAPRLPQPGSVPLPWSTAGPSADGPRGAGLGGSYHRLRAWAAYRGRVLVGGLGVRAARGGWGRAGEQAAWHACCMEGIRDGSMRVPA